ncbi:MAG: trypsin-like serine protease [Archangium sp.]
MTRALTLLLASTLVACSSGTEVNVSRGEAILGGQAAPDERAIFFLDTRGDNGITSTCSATLIAPRTLMTAAHCVDPAVLSATTLTIVATNAPSLADVQPGVNTWNVVETRLHPDWRPQFGLANDLAFALLESAPVGVTPISWNRAPIEGRTGELLRVLGYGTNDATDAGIGVRREATLMINQIGPKVLTLGDGVSKGICHGDSGGPSLLLFNDGVERVVGVHSYTSTPTCVDGADTRVDFHWAFVSQWLMDKEQTCARDFICNPTCPMADPDCRPDGERCDHPLDCGGRTCRGDAQHSEPYCTARCQGTTACPSNLRCDTASAYCTLPQLPVVDAGMPCVPLQSFCLGDTHCDGASRELAVCSRSCTDAADCANGDECRPGFTGQFVCTRKPITLPIAKWEGPRAPGCATSDAGVVWLALALWARRRFSARS